MKDHFECLDEAPELELAVATMETEARK